MQQDCIDISFRSQTHQQAQVVTELLPTTAGNLATSCILRVSDRVHANLRIASFDADTNVDEDTTGP